MPAKFEYEPFRKKALKVRQALAKKFQYSPEAHKRGKQERLNDITSRRIMSSFVLRQAAANTIMEAEKRKMAQQLGSMLAKKINEQNFSGAVFKPKSVSFTSAEIELAKKTGAENLEKMLGFVRGEFLRMQEVSRNSEAYERGGIIPRDLHVHWHGTQIAYSLMIELKSAIRKGKK